MKVKYLAFAVVMLALALAPAVAGAQTLKGSAKINKSGAKGDLGILFTESGLVAGTTVGYSVSADVSVSYLCNGALTTTAPAKNQFGLGLKASNKGIIRQLTSIQVPDSPCPAGQTATFTGVTYANVTVADLTNGVALSLGNYSASF